ncbi:uncharacterized protein BDZ99DRAFT_457276 [Mytilinidion resinicola]|uniref:Uncharacterized protein n=1 Tax=Mytilinidion resinicola TaxID=574789 RepID=A0A6A6Z8V6_9PEZI|nr:uncharacterized protein BDZ99DRAFT_457276 [Mytilinidion resinicola]KAF2817552.1 hypothetical protein BDZ99DRAFT_457276 [Mytilinidion resinicola]
MTVSEKSTKPTEATGTEQRPAGHVGGNPEDDPVNPEDDPVNPEDDQVNPEDDPVNPEDDQVNPEDDPVNPEDDPVNPEDDPVNPKYDPGDPENDPGDPAKKPSGPHVNGHVVQTRRTEDGHIVLCIHVSGAAIGTHRCDSYFPSLNANAVFRQGDINTPPFLVAEHGWFQHRNTFRGVCMSTPVDPNQPDQDAAFKAWRSAVLLTLRNNHIPPWIPVSGV